MPETTRLHAVDVHRRIQVYSCTCRWFHLCRGSSQIHLVKSSVRVAAGRSCYRALSWITVDYMATSEAATERSITFPIRIEDWNVGLQELASDREIIGKLVEIHSLKRNKYANGYKGCIQGAHGSRWLVHIFNPKTMMAVNAENLCYLDEEWCKTTHVLSCFNQNAMIQHFGAPGRYPPKLAELKDISKPPSWRKLLDFWGENVYEYMVDKLDSAIDSAANSNNRRGLFWDFENCNREVALAMVFSDGSKSTQHAPLDSCAGSMFWPVLVPISYVETSIQSTCNLEWFPASLCTSAAIPTWCQAQAVSGSRPYLSHPSRILIRSSRPVEVLEPGPPGHWVHASTVTIEQQDE